MQSVVRPVQKFGPVSRWLSVIALAVAVTAVVVIVRDTRSNNAPTPVTVTPPSARAFRLVAGKGIPAPGAAAIIKHGNTLLVASFAREGGLIRLVEHHATLRPAKHSLPHAVIHAHAGPTITLATRGSSYYIRSGTRTWKLTGHHVQSVAATKLSPAVARQLAGTVGMGRVWIAAHQKLFAVSPAGHRHLVSVGPSRLPKNGLAPVNSAPVVAAGSIWVTQSATSAGGADLGYLQRVHPSGRRRRSADPARPRHPGAGTGRGRPHLGGHEHRAPAQPDLAGRPRHRSRAWQHAASGELPAHGRPRHQHHAVAGHQ